MSFLVSFYWEKLFFYVGKHWYELKNGKTDDTSQNLSTPFSAVTVCLVTSTFYLFILFPDHYFIPINFHRQILYRELCHKNQIICMNDCTWRVGIKGHV